MRYTTTAKMGPEDVIRTAVDYFGPDGLGLKTCESTPRSAQFEAPDGFVTITVECEDRTTVNISTREYDFDAQQFMARIK